MIFSEVRKPKHGRFSIFFRKNVFQKRILQTSVTPAMTTPIFPSLIRHPQRRVRPSASSLSAHQYSFLLASKMLSWAGLGPRKSSHLRPGWCRPWVLEQLKCSPRALFHGLCEPSLCTKFRIILSILHLTFVLNLMSCFFLFSFGSCNALGILWYFDICYVWCLTLYFVFEHVW